VTRAAAPAFRAYHARMKPVRAVFFDLDATLLDYDAAAWAQTVHRVCAALAQAAPGIDETHLFQTYTDVYRAHLHATEGSIARSPGGAADARTIWQELWEHALTGCGHPGSDIARHATDLYVRERRARYRLFDDVTDVLSALRTVVDALAIVTNGPGDAQRDKIAATGLDGRFDLIVVSGEAGVAKPDRAIFDHALRRLGLGPREVWHVGDGLATDIAGARNAELSAAVWLNRAGAAHRGSHPPPRYEIGSLRELPALIERDGLRSDRHG
jgi:putative hydrolase of the HAD superfamily